MDAIGDRIRTARERAGFSQAEMGRRLGRSKTYVNNLEAEKRSVKVSALQEIARVTGTPITALLGTSDDASSPAIPAGDVLTFPGAEIRGLLHKLADTIQAYGEMEKTRVVEVEAVRAATERLAEENRRLQGENERLRIVGVEARRLEIEERTQSLLHEFALRLPAPHEAGHGDAVVASGV